MEFAMHLFYFFNSVTPDQCGQESCPTGKLGRRHLPETSGSCLPTHHLLEIPHLGMKQTLPQGLASSCLRNISRKTRHRLPVFPAPNGPIVKGGLFLIYPGECGGRETPPFHLGDNKLILHYN